MLDGCVLEQVEENPKEIYGKMIIAKPLENVGRRKKCGQMAGKLMITMYNVLN